MPKILALRSSGKRITLPHFEVSLVYKVSQSELHGKAVLASLMST